jgi:hypothetical protein
MSTVHAGLRSNATTGGASTIHAEYLADIRCNVVRRTNYSVHAGIRSNATSGRASTMHVNYTTSVGTQYRELMIEAPLQGKPRRPIIRPHTHEVFTPPVIGHASLKSSILQFIQYISNTLSKTSTVSGDSILRGNTDNAYCKMSATGAASEGIRQGNQAGEVSDRWQRVNPAREASERTRREQPARESGESSQRQNLARATGERIRRQQRASESGESSQRENPAYQARAAIDGIRREQAARESSESSQRANPARAASERIRRVWRE